MRLMGAGVCSVVVAALYSVASAQSPTPMPNQVQTPAPSIGAAGTPQNLLVIVSGCIERESDFRREREGASAVTVIGNDSGVILTHAVVTVTGSQIAGSSAQAPDEPSTGATATRAAGSQAATPGATYQLIGSREGEAAALVGQLVEITGALSESPVTEPPPARPAGPGPQVTDVTSRELHLRQLDVESVRALSETCTAP